MTCMRDPFCPGSSAGTLHTWRAFDVQTKGKEIPPWVSPLRVFAPGFSSTAALLGPRFLDELERELALRDLRTGTFFSG